MNRTFYCAELIVYVNNNGASLAQINGNTLLSEFKFQIVLYLIFEFIFIDEALTCYSIMLVYE